MASRSFTRSAAAPEWSRQLRRSRERRAFSRAALAARTGLSASAIKAFETGRRHPREATLNAVIDALGLPREEANELRLSAGHPGDWYAVLVNRFPSDAAALEAELHTIAWPAFVSNQAADVVFANRAFQRFMGVDLESELLGPGERNFLAQASNPRFVARFENFDEVVTYLIGLVKGDPRWRQSPANPAPWLQTAVDHFSRGDPVLISRVLHLWEAAPAIPHRVRHSYSVRVRLPGGLIGRLRGSTTIADLWNELSWNEWVPADEKTWQALEEMSSGTAPDVRLGDV